MLLQMARFLFNSCIIFHCSKVKKKDVLWKKILYIIGRVKSTFKNWWCFSVAKSCPTLQLHGSTTGFPVLHHLLEFAQIHVHWVSDAIQPSHLLSPSSPLLSVIPSIRVFPNEWAVHIRWPKYWRFSLSISPFNDYSELSSFRIDWFDLLAGQGTLESLLQHHSLQALILQCSAFFGLP